MLIHHGIKGMHWGVRRYQNYDGTLTGAGRLHVKNYRQHQKNFRNVEKAQRDLMNDPKVKKAMDTTSDQIDDWELVELVAQEVNSGHMKKVNEAHKVQADFYRENKDSIEIGKKS